MDTQDLLQVQAGPLQVPPLLSVLWLQRNTFSTRVQLRSSLLPVADLLRVRSRCVKQDARHRSNSERVLLAIRSLSIPDATDSGTSDLCNLACGHGVPRFRRYYHVYAAKVRDLQTS